MSVGLRGFVKCLADGHHCANIVLAHGFLAGGSRQEKASVRLPCSGKKLAANEMQIPEGGDYEAQNLV